jgi:FtsP/CotA-like multicopper oxidase with cupredoxin domain
MIVVVPSEPDYWPRADRELALALDDVLLEGGSIAPFSRTETTHVAMGRFGNLMLANGEPDLALSARRGEVVRFYLTNTANTRVFDVAFAGARMKLVGGDSGRCEHEQLVDRVLIAPSERAVVDVSFSEPGRSTLEHRTPKRVYRLADVSVADGPAGQPAAPFDQLRTNADLAAERERIAAVLVAEPHKTLALVAEMNLDAPEASAGGAVVYVCPMHPEVSSDEPGRCPQCGMKLLARAPTAEYACPMHPEVRSDRPGRCPQCGMKLVPAQMVARPTAAEHSHAAQHGEHGSHGEHGEHGEPAPEASEAQAAGIEWEDDMVDLNRMTTPANTRWKLIDRATGAAGTAIDWRFRVGDRVKIRVVNSMDSDHPMHHPFHIHGAGRFLVLARDGAVETNLVWKDTVLVRTGQTVDLLLDVTNPGVWMAHCHIAEHHESGMMFSFRVDP